MQTEKSTCLPHLKTQIALTQKTALDQHSRAPQLTRARYLRAHIRNHRINKTVHQIDPKATNMLLKPTSSLRRSQGHHKR
jgi:hypothetical protein